MESAQPWVTCFLTEILLTYLEERHPTNVSIDYPALFRHAEGFVPRPKPEAFLRDGSNCGSGQ